jgi:hypothetical protein
MKFLLLLCSAVIALNLRGNEQNGIPAPKLNPPSIDEIETYFNAANYEGAVTGINSLELEDQTKSVLDATAKLAALAPEVNKFAGLKPEATPILYLAVRLISSIRRTTATLITKLTPSKNAKVHNKMSAHVGDIVTNLTKIQKALVKLVWEWSINHNVATAIVQGHMEEVDQLAQLHPSNYILMWILLSAGGVVVIGGGIGAFFLLKG